MTQYCTGATSHHVAPCSALRLALHTADRHTQTDRNTYRQTDRHTQTDRNTYRQTDRQTQTDRNTYRQTDRHTQTDRNTYRQTDRHTQTDRNTYRQTDTHTDRNTYRQTDRHTQTDRNTYRQTDRHTQTETHRGVYPPLTPWSKFPSLPLPLPLEVGPLIAARGSGERFSSPSGSGRSPAAKRYLVNFSLKISPLVATIFRRFSGNETSNYDF